MKDLIRKYETLLKAVMYEILDEEDFIKKTALLERKAIITKVLKDLKQYKEKKGEL